MQLLNDLEDHVINRELYENLGEMIQFPDESGHDKFLLSFEIGPSGLKGRGPYSSKSQIF